jgi:CheY-like chemotaxis protein
LLIEDTAAIRYYVRSILEMLGYDAVEACDGRDGLQRYRQFPVATVITDLQMPDLDGFDVIRELRNDFPDVNIIAMSGDPQLLHRAQQLGAHYTIEKPFDPEALSQAIHDCQDGRLGNPLL